MLTKHLCVLIHIRIKGEVGTVKLEVFHLWTFFAIRRCFFCGSFFVTKAAFLLRIFFVICVCLCHAVMSASCSFVVACWESADLLAVLCMMFPCAFVTFTFGVLGHMWYLIVWIPDLCLLSYF